MVGWQELRGRAALGSGGTEWDTDVAHEPVGSSLALWVASAGLVVSAAMHVIVIPEHFREFEPYGWFFVVLAGAQLFVAAALLRRPDHRTVGYVALASVWVVALWLVSRTTGLPTGPEPWQPEPYGVADVVASCAGLIAAIGCFMELWALPERRVAESRERGVLSETP